MKANITITGHLADIDPDDFQRLQKQSADTLLRALLLNGAKVETRVTEVDGKTETKGKAQ